MGSCKRINDSMELVNKKKKEAVEAGFCALRGRALVAQTGGEGANG